MRAHRRGLAGLEVEQVRDDGRRAEVEREREAARRSCRPARRRASRSSQSTAVTLPVGRAQRAGRAVRTRSSGTRSSTSSIAASTRSRSERLVLERRLRQLEEALLHGRAQDHVPADADERRLRPRLQRRHLDDEVLLAPARGTRAASRPAARRPRTRADRRRESGSVPDATRTLHFLHVPWPPQVESIATPFQLAASKSVVPAGTRASFTAAPFACSKRSRTRSGCAAGRVSAALTSRPPPASRGSARSSARPTRRGRAGGRPRARRRRTPASARP